MNPEITIKISMGGEGAAAGTMAGTMATAPPVPGPVEQIAGQEGIPRGPTPMVGVREAGSEGAPPEPLPLDLLATQVGAVGVFAAALPTPTEGVASAGMTGRDPRPVPYDVAPSGAEGAGEVARGPEPMALEELAESAGPQQPEPGEKPEEGRGRLRGGRKRE